MALWHPLWVAREQLEYTGQHSPFDHVLLNSFAGFNTYSVVFPISSTPWSGPLKQITIRALRTTSFSPSFRLPFQPPKKPAPGGPGGGGVFSMVYVRYISPDLFENQPTNQRWTFPGCLRFRKTGENVPRSLSVKAAKKALKDAQCLARRQFDRWRLVRPLAVSHRKQRPKKAKTRERPFFLHGSRWDLFVEYGVLDR